MCETKIPSLVVNWALKEIVFKGGLSLFEEESISADFVCAKKAPKPGTITQWLS